MLNPLARQEFEKELVRGVALENITIDCHETIKTRWMDRIRKNVGECVKPTIAPIGRRMNNFCLGSDPEFVFVLPGSSHKTNAVDLGLRPALAAGSDQNRRLAELRGWPTKSVVEHLAGILTSLRWMYRIYPDVRSYYWRSGAYYDSDGIGGHVHFGRKRPNRTNEIEGLDGVARVFRNLLMFPNKEWDRRQQGDAHRQIYGGYGDIRQQLHGYEYRTLPSWLCNPTKAFLVLTATKLAILDPSLTANWFKQRTWGVSESLTALKHLANYYAGRDDDAQILKYILNRPVPAKKIFGFSELTNDFKPAWGFSSIITPPTKLPSRILAACVEPLPSETEEIITHLVDSTDLLYKENPPTFKNVLPTDYFWFYDSAINNIGWSGVGDLCHNLVMFSNAAFNIRFAERANISRDFFSALTVEEQKYVKINFPSMFVTAETSRTVTFSRDMLTVPNIQKTRHFLLKTGMFPLWTVDSVEESSFPKWKETRKSIKGSRKPRIEERVI